MSKLRKMKMSDTLSQKSANKKAQVMMFLIVGLVLLILFGFLYFVVNQARDAELSDSQKSGFTQIQASSNEISQIISQCLETAADDALYKIGVQGGHIYSNQYGDDSQLRGIPHTIDNDEYIVPFGIIRSPNEPAAPLYPLVLPQEHRYSLGFLELNFPEQSVWGTVSLPKLCDRFGPNGPSDNNLASCDTFAMGFGNQTMQRKLEIASLRATRLCIDFSKDVIDRKTKDFILSASELEVLLTDSSVRFTLSLNASAAVGESTLNINEFTYNAPVRLKRVYNLAHQILFTDTTNVSFTKDRDYINLNSCNYDGQVQCYDEHMQVGVYRDIHPQFPGSAILEVVDNRSTINGRPFKFLVSVENRPPMLDYYREATISLDPTVDIQRAATSTLTILPQAFDPDGDKITIRYYGWKSLGFNASNMYQNQATYDANCDGRDAWCAEYELINFKPSIRSFKLEACDPHGLCDFQIIKVEIGSPDPSKLDFCPIWLKDTKTAFRTTCGIGETNCVCDNNQFCDYRNEQRDVLCKDGAICCHSVAAGTDRKMTCETGAQCYQSAPYATATQFCQSGSSCFQETISGNLYQNCALGTTCYQEVVDGAGTVECAGTCRQENDFGDIYMSCSGIKNPNTQGGTLNICN
jgi:hypothetical protein